MATLGAVLQKKAEPSAEETAAKELVRPDPGAGPVPDWPGGLLGQPTKSVLETAVHEELTERLGHAKHRAQLGLHQGPGPGPGRRRS